MNEDLDIELEKEEESSVRPTDESAIETESPASRFVNDFEDTLKTGDPFRLVQRVARTSTEVLADAKPDSRSGLFPLSQSANQAMQSMGERVVQSALSTEQPSRLRISGTQTSRLQGFTSRALASDYQSLLERPGEFKATFFQFQQESVVSSLLKRTDPTTLITQRAAFTSPRADQTTAEILLGNELTYAAGAALRLPTHNVLGVQSYASFHPKVGYVGDSQKGFTAFLGTQNITPALQGNNSLETLMTFTTPGTRAVTTSPTSFVEQSIAQEIYQLTNSISDLANQEGVYRPGQLRRYLTQNQVQRNFLYVEQEIHQRITQALTVAAFNAASKKDRVVISMGEISLLLKQSKNSTSLLQAIAQLARENRLNIITDSKRVNNFFDELRSNPVLSHNRALVDLLLQTGSLKVATTGYQHDKTVAIFGESNQLRFFNVGSANFSADSMTAVKDLGANREYFDSALAILKQQPNSFDNNAPLNLDVNLMLGSGPYADNLRAAPAAEAYLKHLAPQLYNHYSNLSAGWLQSRTIYHTGYLAERRADPTKVEQLRQGLEVLSQELGGLLEVTGRYSTDQGKATQVGLTVRVKALGSSSVQTTLKLSVDRYGNVILPETNKVIPGSVFVNKTSQVRRVVGRDVAPGASAQLTGVETAVGLIGTISRELSYQAKFGIVDTLFERMGTTQFQTLKSASRTLLAKSIQASNEVFKGNPQLNLVSLLSALNTDELDAQFGPTLLNAQQFLATGDSSLQLTDKEKQQRFKALQSVFSEFSEPSNWYSDNVDDVAARRLLQTLSTDTKGLLTDLKLALVLSTEEGRRQYQAIQNTQARRLVQDLTAPFLAAHELGYSAMQGQARLPIYAESEIYDTSTAYGKVLNSGFLNPALVKPGTKVGQPGQYFRPVGATSHAKKLSLPGFGNIRQLNIIDADISTGAAVTYDIKRLFSSTSGLARIEKEQYIQQMHQVFNNLGIEAPVIETDEVQYLLPFTKAEQIPQRLKNVVGSRPALDVNPELVRKLRSLQQVKLGASSLLAGRLREVLPQTQFEELAAKATQDFASVQEYFRSSELDPLNTQRGFIGPRSMKRVAIVGGVSLIGDSSYLNSGYELYAGDMQRMTVKVSSRQVTNQLQTQALLSKYLAPGTTIFSAPVTLADNESSSLLAALQQSLESTGQAVTVTTLQRALETYENGKFKNVLVKRDGSRYRLYYQEGLYSPTKDGYERIGSFDKDGLITVRGVGTQQDTLWGSRHQPITLKFQAFNKRHQAGISVITSAPSIQVSDSGTMIVSTDVLTAWEPGTGSRPTGAGLVKGPFSVIKPEIFKDIDKLVSQRTSLKPQALANESLYGLFGHGHFKGFNYETGLYLLSQQDTREAVAQLSGQQVAQSLSLLFLGDEQIKAALQTQLKSSGLDLAADAISHVKATDFAQLKNGKPSTALGRVALGLTSLSDLPTAAQDASIGSLASVKQTVLRALQNDSQAIQVLETQTRKLINTVINSPESAIQFSSGEVVLNESNLVARGAGLLAHLSFVGQQLFNPAITPGRSVNKLYERDLSDAQKYITDVAYRNVVDTVAATAGMSLPAPSPKNRQDIQRKLSLLQAMIQNDVVIEDIKDITVSRSLVPTGMKDEAAMEYQYLLGMSSSYLKAFTKVGGGSQASQELQSAFARLLGSFRVDLPSANAQLGYRLALPGEDSQAFFSTLAQDTQSLLLSYTELGEKLNLVQSSIEEVTTAKGSTALRRLQRFQRLATGMTADGTSQLEARAIAANKLFNLSYFSDQKPEDSKAAKLQVSHLRKTLSIQNTFAPGESALSITTQVVRRAYQSYQEDRFFRKQNGQIQTSFQSFVSEGSGGRVAQALEEKYGLITELAQDSFRIPGVPLTDDTAILDTRIAQRIQRINERSLNSIQNAYDTSIYKEFVQGALNLESKLQVQAANDRSNQVSRVLQEIQNTKQVILPQFTAEAITEGENVGRYRLKMLDPGEYDPTVGVMMGTDILRRAPLLFPQYTDEALRYQVELRQKLLETSKVREQLLNPGATVSEKQLRQLQDLQETLEGSRASTLRLLDTDFTRKALGDRQQFEGTVGIAIGSFALDATEAVLGQRYNALGSTRNTLAVVENQFRLVEMALNRSSKISAVPAELQQTLTNTYELTRALGYRTNEDQVNQQFQTALEAAERKTLTRQQLADLRVQTLSALANIPAERVQQTSPNDLDKLLNLSSGSIRRGGAPAGSAALTADSNFYDVLDVQSLQARLTNEGSGLIPESERFKTGMQVPAVGRLLAMLGDFDGDAYQFLLTGVGDHASQLSHLQRATLQLGQKLGFLDRQINQTNTQELQQERQAVQQQFNEVSQQLSEQVQKVSQFSSNIDRTQNRALKDVRKWVGSYLALPDFITDEQSSLSTGTLMSMVQQMSGTMPQIEDAAHHIKYAEEHLSLLTSAFGSSDSLTSDQLDPSNPQTRSKINQLLQQNNSLSASMVEGVLRYANQQESFTSEAFESSARTYLALQSNLSMTFEQVNKSMKKASGLILNPFDFEGLQGVIGQAGTELIGKTYNVLVPLLDQTMLDQALVTSLQTTGQSSFRSVIDQNLQAMAQESTIEEATEINKLRRKLLTEDHQGLQQQLSARFSAVTGTLASLQQIIRDALKEKSDKGIINVLREASYEGKPLAEALETVEADSPLEADKRRSQILKQAVMTRIGPNLGIGSDSQDYGITGFGALLKLSEFAMTDSDEQLYEKFVTEPGLEDTYRQQIKEGKVSSVSEFAASQVLSLVERAQASFISGTFSSSTQETLINQFRQFHNDADQSKLSPVNHQIYQVIDEYEQQRQQLSDNSELTRLNNRLLQDTTLIQIQHRNKEQQVLSTNQLQNLREFYLESQKVRFDDGDVYSRMLGANVDTYNSFLRMLQRGQQPTAQDALYLAEYKINALSNIYDDEANLAPADQMRVARLMGLRAGSGFISDREQAYLAQALTRTSKGGVSGLQSLQSSTAAMTQGVFPLIDELEKEFESPTQDRADVLRQQLAGLYEYGVNVDKLQEVGVIKTPHSVEQTQRLAQSASEQLNKLISPVEELGERPIAHSILQPDSRLEALGLFVAPALLALAGSDVKLDDRVGMFTLDVLQATATLTSRSDTLTAQLAGGSASSKAAFNFSAGRVRQSLETEGLAVGAVQGLIQEGVFQGISRAAYSTIDHFANKLPGGKTKAGNAIATVAAEALSTVLSLGISRAVTKQQTRGEEFVPDRIGDILKNVTEQIWQMVEQAQLAMSDPNYEVLDTTENQSMNFEVSAVPSQFEQDIQSGLIVLDEEGNQIATEFESSSSEQVQLAGSF